MSKEKNKIVTLDTVEIKGLFNTFNYEFNYSNPEHVSIVMAPNGCGKTTIFKFIDFLLKPNEESLYTILTIPFKSFICTFSDGRSVGIRTEDKGTIEYFDDLTDAKKKIRHYDFIYWESVADKKEIEFSFFKKLKEIETSSESDDEFLLPIQKQSQEPQGFSEDYIKRIAKRQRWHEYIHDDNNRMARKLSQMIDELNKVIKSKHPDITDIPKIRFIIANRTEKLMRPLDRYSFNRRTFLNEQRERPYSDVDPIDIIQHQIGMKIITLKHQYDMIIDKAKNEIPKLYLDNKVKTPYKNKEEFLKAWEKYTADMDKYSRMGLLFSENIIAIDVNDIQEEYGSEKWRFLGIYLFEYQKAMDVLNNKLLDKLELLFNILNKRNELTDKIIKIGPQCEFIVECRGNEVPLTALSSGEKNDFIMFYSLIFDTKPGSIILVDEPEISLHIEWQEEYLEQLLEICRINNCQAIVATHSPNIINTHVELFAKREVSYEDF